MTEKGQPTVFCAWCRRVIQWGDRGISHGLCETCLPTVAAELEARLETDEAGSSREAAFPRSERHFAWW